MKRLKFFHQLGISNLPRWLRRKLKRLRSGFARIPKAITRTVAISVMLVGVFIGSGPPSARAQSTSSTTINNNRTGNGSWTNSNRGGNMGAATYLNNPYTDNPVWNSNNSKTGVWWGGTVNSNVISFLNNATTDNEHTVSVSKLDTNVHHVWTGERDIYYNYDNPGYTHTWDQGVTHFDQAVNSSDAWEYNGGGTVSVGVGSVSILKTYVDFSAYSNTSTVGGNTPNYGGTYSSSQTVTANYAPTDHFRIYGSTATIKDGAGTLKLQIQGLEIETLTGAYGTLDLSDSDTGVLDTGTLTTTTASFTAGQIATGSAALAAPTLYHPASNNVTNYPGAGWTTVPNVGWGANSFANFSFTSGTASNVWTITSPITNSNGINILGYMDVTGAGLNSLNGVTNIG